jgi:hypothetical protein
MEEQQSVLFSLGIDEIAQTHLTSIAKWNRFMAIVGIVGSFLGIIVLVFGGSFLFSTFSRLGNTGETAGYNSGVFAGTMFFYILFIAAYLIPCFFRLSFSNKMLKAITNTDQEMLNESLRQLKLYSKYWGILTIVGLAIYALIFIIAIFAGFMR